MLTLITDRTCSVDGVINVFIVFHILSDIHCYHVGSCCCVWCDCCRLWIIRTDWATQVCQTTIEVLCVVYVMRMIIQRILATCS